MNRIEVDALKDRHSCQEVAEKLLTRRGKRFWCPRCQTSDSKTPDLATKKSRFRCYKCDWSGDVIELVMECLRCDFRAAVEYLDGDAGWLAKSQPRRPDQTKAIGVLSGAQRGDIYLEFLAGCRQVQTQALAYLTGRGISADVVARMGLRFCGREYADLMKTLEKRLGKDKLLDVGLMVAGKNSSYPVFWPYYAAKIGFVIIPYFQDGQPVYLKARPPIDKAIAEERTIARFLNTGGSVPCLYNVDTIKSSDQILICEGETDTLTALSCDFAAVGAPGWAHFKAQWAGLFAGKQVFLVLDNDDAGERGVQDIAMKFSQSRLPLPKKLTLPRGQDLNEYLLKVEKVKR